MRWNETELLAILPQWLRNQDYSTVQEIRLRVGMPPRLITGSGFRELECIVGESDLNFTINAASRYSPWNVTSLADGYLTAPGGHRIGVCGEGAGEGLRNVTSLCIRVARDIAGIAAGLPMEDSLLILGPPGSGKTTLLREYIRQVSRRATVSVVDERRELFPEGFYRSWNTDVLTGIPKSRGIDMVLRAMSPEVIAMDEVTCQSDCDALIRAAWCGVRLIATAHASSIRDLRERTVYRPLVETGLFRNAVVLDRNKNWHLGEVTP